MRDYSEPCFWVSVVFGAASTVYSVIIGAGYWIAASACLCFTGSLGAQRAHSLGLASSLGQSADTYREENAKLLEVNKNIKKEVGELRVQVDDLRGISGLLDGTEENLREVETRLRATYQGIRGENLKHQNNNLVSLFSLVDQDRDGILSPAEVKRLEEFVEMVYGKKVVFSSLDRDGDGTLTLTEFIALFSPRGGLDVQITLS